MGAVRTNWYLIVPLGALVFLLFSGYTPLFSGTVGLALTVILIFGDGGGRPAVGGPRCGRCSGSLLGLLSSTFFKYGIGAVFAVIGPADRGQPLYVQGGRRVLKLAVTGMAEGARNALSVGVACALVGGDHRGDDAHRRRDELRRVDHQLGQHSLFLSLVLTMLTCLVLGMGIPTIPNYIITSSLAAPALLALGVPLIVSHMFVFYFGIMADLTPPVALAAFAASPIAQASGLRIGIQAMRIAMPASWCRSWRCTRQH